MRRLIDNFRLMPFWIRLMLGILLALMLVLVMGGALFCALSRVLSGLGESDRGIDHCVEGTPGSPAVFTDLQKQLFIFPGSAANIKSECTSFQTAEIHVWFEMAADENELESFLDSMQWDVRPLTSTTESPAFGNPSQNVSYFFGEYAVYPEGASVWVDNSGTTYRVFIEIWLD